MQTLYDQYNQLMELTPMNFFREQHDTINWDVRILGILGQKGVGKSTLILQHIKRAGNKDESTRLSIAAIICRLRDDFFATVRIRRSSGRIISFSFTYSSLLPPVGVWSVSQYQCGGPSSQNPYASSPWWAVAPPTS